MTLADVRRLFAYWRRYPPLRDLVAAFVGFKPDQPWAEPAAPINNDNNPMLAALAAQAKAQGGAVAAIL